MKNFIYIFSALLFLSSCESLIIKDLEIDDTNFEKQLVVQSFIEANTDSIVAFISENESILAEVSEIKFMDDADVQLFYEGSEIAKLEQSENGRYYHFFDTPIVETGSYEIKVSNTPYEDASASSIMPEDVGISDLDFRYDVGQDPLDMTSVSEVSFVINDPPGKNYYTMKLEGISGGIDTLVFGMDTIFNEQVIYVYPASTQLDPSVSMTGYDGDFIINDDSFDGQTKEVKVRVSFSRNTSSPGYEDELKEQLKLTFTSHSEDSFKYETSVDAYYDSRDFALFAEPVSVYTNIENGLGVFGALSKKEYFFE